MPLDDVVVRAATLHDIEGIRRVGLLTWPPTYLPITDADYVMANLNRWWSRDAVESSITEDSTWVAVVDDEIVGTATLGQYGGEPVVWKIYVLPRLHGTGVARGLMDGALESVASEQDVLIEFVEGNDRARRFYEKVGFAHERTERGELGTTTIWYRLARNARRGRTP